VPPSGAPPKDGNDGDEDTDGDDDDDEDEEEYLRGEAAVAGLSSTMNRIPLLCRVNSTTCFSRAAAKAAVRAAPGSVTTVGEGVGVVAGAFALAADAPAADAACSSVAAESRAERRVAFIVGAPSSPSRVSTRVLQTGDSRGLLLGSERGRCEGRKRSERDDIDSDGDAEESAAALMARIVLAKIVAKSRPQVQPLKRLGATDRLQSR